MRPEHANPQAALTVALAMAAGMGAQLEDRAACIALTPNEEVNLMWARSAVEHFDMERVYVACRRDRSTVTPALVEQSDGSVLFGQPRDLELWSLRFGRGTAEVETWRRGKSGVDSAGPTEFPENLVLPLLILRKDKVRPFDSSKPPKTKDALILALYAEQREQAEAWLLENGYDRSATE